MIFCTETEMFLKSYGTVRQTQRAALRQIRKPGGIMSRDCKRYYYWAEAQLIKELKKNSTPHQRT